MPELHINEIAEAVGGIIENKNASTPDTRFSHYHFDTRLITEPATLFFAMKTNEGDGHRFLPQLEGKPGMAAVVNNDFDTSHLTFPIIRVMDTLKAAQILATYVRNSYRHIKYIGVTGSAGKTTTKEFIFQLLSHKFNSYRSFKNWNNWLGMPFSILNMSGREEAAVFELAMSDPGIGEIHLLSEILRPDVSVILNVFPVHLEFLKTVENAAKAKSEILDFLASDDVAFINANSEPLMKIMNGPNSPKGRKIFFAPDDGSSFHSPDTRLKEISREGESTRIKIDCFGIETDFVTPFINRLHVQNLFVAILVAQHLGMKNFEIQQAIQNIVPLSDRGLIEKHGDFTIINETYNSNPEALKRTLEWVANEYNGINPTIAVVGDMLELGENESEFHEDVGRFFSSLKYNMLITVGKRAFKIATGASNNGYDSTSIHSFDDATAAGKFLKTAAPKNAVILFKASRGICLENAVKEFMNE